MRWLLGMLLILLLLWRWLPEPAPRPVEETVIAPQLQALERAEAVERQQREAAARRQKQIEQESGG